MEDLGLALLATGLGAGGLLLAAQTQRAAAARTGLRSGYFEDCIPLLATPRLGRGAGGFPRLAGAYEGHETDLQAVPDTLTFRKLPALWVMVTLLCPLPLRATLHVMIRPTGIEPFSNFNTLPDQIAPPAGFPDDCAIRTDDPAGVISESEMRPFVSVFDNPRVKELVISPKGLRITFLAEEANRGRYLIFRDSEMGSTPLNPTRVTPMLDRLVQMHGQITASQQKALA